MYQYITDCIAYLGILPAEAMPMQIKGVATGFHCVNIPKNRCWLIFDSNRPAPENQLEDKTQLKQWS
jgi:hypothetical protein